MGGYLDLWLRRASDDAVASFSKDWWQTIPVFGIGSLLQFSLSGSAAVKEEASSFLLYGVAAVMVWGTLKVAFFAITAPYRLWKDERRQVRHLTRELSLATATTHSRLRVEPSPRVNYAWSEKQVEGRKGLLSPIRIGFEVTVKNLSDEPLLDCQVWTRSAPAGEVANFLTQMPWVPASGVFALRPREELSHPLYWTDLETDDPRLSFVSYYERDGRWLRAEHAPHVMPNHIVELEVRSMSTPPTRLKFVATREGLDSKLASLQDEESSLPSRQDTERGTLP
ncbi:hypothetical protein LRS10_07140 [Phenylobacterium sp. J426]|uniref:hypothetical protein n=1 Tax=Phenylobacterium sp. J426 TaxID=2898439 RepID=UPI00215130AD|nr:hypothetical protein [Phenylobacterium sp. J426]MCR5873964.1 hypothetical protein [Phenylobacterium sp. J426]